MAQAIYVFGHQNPDTDSICASLSYAYLKQALGNENVVACRLGNINKETKYERQSHFEIFLETICWIGFISIFALEVYLNLFNTIDNYIKNNFVLVICLIIMITLPITLRQILFYLFNVRLINKTSLSMEEINLNEKLKKTNIKL